MDHLLVVTPVPAWGPVGYDHALLLNLAQGVEADAQVCGSLLGREKLQVCHGEIPFFDVFLVLTTIKPVFTLFYA
jgi:hypothetical protein